MRELVTTLLDMLGLLAISAGIVLGFWPIVGGWSLCFGGAVTLSASLLAARGERT